MAIRGTLEEDLLVAGSPEAWLQHAEQALRSSGFKKVKSDPGLGQVRGNYRKMRTWGELYVTASLDREGVTKLHLRATAGKDNIYAAMKDPNVTILDAFKGALPPSEPVPPHGQSSERSLADELERLAALNAQGALSDEEYVAAKARLLS